MAIEAAKLKVVIGAETSEGEAGLKKFGGVVDNTKQGIGGLIESVTGVAVPMQALAGGAIAVGAELRRMVEAAAEAEVVDAKLEAVIKSTGGAAGMTGESIGAMADEMRRATGIDDDLVKSASTVMLTFTSIGKDVFPDAMRAAEDMSAVMGQDLQSSVVQLGKALQDPIEGITALKRVGVNFNDTQKEMIKGLVESGDQMGAQKLILAELNKEFGGAAKAAGDTFNGQLTILKTTIGEIEESIGTEFIPVLTALVKELGKAANGAMLLVNWTNRLDDTIEAHAKEVASTTDSYAEFRKEFIRSAEAAGYNTRVLDANFTATGQSAKGAEELRLKLVGMMDAAWNASNPLEQLNGKFDQMAIDAHAAKDGVDNLKDSTRMLDTNGLKPLDIALGSTDTALDGIKESSDLVVSAMREVTKEMLFQQAAANLDEDAALALAREMGMIDEKSWLLITAMQNLDEQLKLNKITQTEYADEVARMAGVMDYLSSKEWQAIFRVQIEVSGNLPEGFGTPGFGEGDTTGSKGTGGSGGYTVANHGLTWHWVTNLATGEKKAVAGGGPDIEIPGKGGGGETTNSVIDEMGFNSVEMPEITSETPFSPWTDEGPVTKYYPGENPIYRNLPTQEELDTLARSSGLYRGAGSMTREELYNILDKNKQAKNVNINIVVPDQTMVDRIARRVAELVRNG